MTLQIDLTNYGYVTLFPDSLNPWENKELTLQAEGSGFRLSAQDDRLKFSVFFQKTSKDPSSKVSGGGRDLQGTYEIVYLREPNPLLATQAGAIFGRRDGNDDRIRLYPQGYVNSEVWYLLKHQETPQ